MIIRYLVIILLISLLTSCSKEQLEVDGLNSNLPLSISNLQVSSHSSSGFTASISTRGGSGSSDYVLYYCNNTISPGCDPLAGSNQSMTKSGSNQVVVLTGLSNPTNDFNVQVVASDPNSVIGSPISLNTSLLGSAMTISNFSVTGASKLGMDITVDFTGDTEANAIVTLYYCNNSDAPSCDPLVGSSLVMNRNVGDYTTTLAGLPGGFDEGEQLNFQVVVNDTEAAIGSPMSAVDYLADMRLTGIATANVVETAFDLTVNIAETNVNGTANAYYCNETDTPGCDPLAGTIVAMTRVGGQFELNVNGLSNPNDFGDELNIQVVGADIDGVSNQNLTTTIRLADFEISLINVYGVSLTGFFVDLVMPNGNNDTNANLSINLFWCNDTDNPGCDPLVSGNTSPNIGGWHAFGFNVTGLSEDAGDELSVAVQVNDVDGVYVNTGAMSYSETLTTTIKLPNPKNIFRSVGPGQTGPLETHISNGQALSIHNGTVFFANPILDIIGVGDAIYFDSDANGSLDSLVFIHGRADNQNYTVRTVAGAVGGQFLISGSWAIYRSYTSASDAENGIENSGIALNTAIDLAVLDFDSWTLGKDISAQTGSDELWNVALYAGIQADTTPLEISTDWIKDKGNTIKFFVPKDPGHVGTSQRHTGIWDNTKYRLVITDSTAVYTHTNTTTIEGLQIEVAGTANNLRGIYGRNNSEGTISHNIIRNTGTGENLSGCSYYIYSQRGVNNTLYYNNLIYDFSTTGSFGFYVEWQSQTSNSVKLFNNTIYNSYIGFHNRTYNASYLVNNIIAGSVLRDVEGDSGFRSVYNNIFSDGTMAPFFLYSGADNQHTVDKTTIFNDVDNYDFTLASGSSGIDTGFDSSADYLDDITGSNRNADFDIGAFESPF